jgi:light-regulated signal transduction histidine kinase (bacteriophytochrome)
LQFNKQLYVWNDKKVLLVAHQNNELLFIELEFVHEYHQVEESSFEIIERYKQDSKNLDTTTGLLNTAAKYLKLFSGYDRVMVYKFHEDGHGEVVGEAKEEELVPYYGLHYPVSDIPYSARKLFLTNEIRIISDIDRPSSPLLYRPNLELTNSFDLTYTNLRASSPIHLEYLRNMGVKSTFTVAIKNEGKLWGLYAFHHYSPRLISYKARKWCNYLGEYFSMIFIQDSLKDAKQTLKQQNSLLKKVYTNLDQFPDLYSGLKSNKDHLLQLFGANGLVIQLNGKKYSDGYVPSEEQLSSILSFLGHQKSHAVFETCSIDDLIAKSDAEPIGGILFLRLSDSIEDFILFFKKPIVQVVNWGGNPTKSVTIQKEDANEPYRLSPRKSFEIWKEEINSKSYHCFLISLVYKTLYLLQNVNQRHERCFFPKTKECQSFSWFVSGWAGAADERPCFQKRHFQIRKRRNDGRLQSADSPGKCLGRKDRLFLSSFYCTNIQYRVS